MTGSVILVQSGLKVVRALVQKYEDYWITHRDQCTANYRGTSLSMESTVAVEVWKRSIDKHNFAYGTYIEVGDSSTFKNLRESNPYNRKVTIRKEDCIGD